MNGSSIATLEVGYTKRYFYGSIVFVLLIGAFRADTSDLFVSYFLITISAIFPIALWFRAGTPGIPILAVVATLHYIYYGVPLLRERGSDIDALPAAAAVSMFLTGATLTWVLLFTLLKRRPHEANAHSTLDWQVRRLAFAGLILGIVFEFSFISGWVWDFAAFLGSIRAVTLTGASLACYLIGFLRARDRLYGRAWIFAFAGLTILVLLSWRTLYLVGGLMYLLATILGYTITARRIPWKVLALLFSISFVLNAGKGQMRDLYWTEAPNEDLSVLQTPAFFAEWFIHGVDAITTPDREPSDIIDRASLLHMLLRVQQLTPDPIPYLEGGSYRFLISSLVPRFFETDKPPSQAGLMLLNIRYGFLNSGDITSIAWGVISEGFANFGYTGVVAAGILIGAISAVFTCLSNGAPPLAPATLVSIGALVCLSNIEADFSALVVALWQTIIASLLFLLAFKYFVAEGAVQR